MFKKESIMGMRKLILLLRKCPWTIYLPHDVLGLETGVDPSRVQKYLDKNFPEHEQIPRKIVLTDLQKKKLNMYKMQMIHIHDERVANRRRSKAQSRRLAAETKHECSEDVKHVNTPDVEQPEYSEEETRILAANEKHQRDHQRKKTQKRRTQEHMSDVFYKNVMVNNYDNLFT
ncbi:hypothetical protein [Salmon gill poxvirus]